MNLQQIEEGLLAKLTWETVGDIPEFPFENFADLQLADNNGRFLVRIWPSAFTNELASWIHGRGYATLFALFYNAPFFIAIVSIVLVFVLSNYWLLLGIVLGFGGHGYGIYRSTPEARSKPIPFMLYGSLILLGIAIWGGLQTLAILCTFWIYPSLTSIFVNRTNKLKLKHLAMRSEPVFMMLYLEGEIIIRDSTDGEVYQHQPNRQWRNFGYVNEKNVD
jgi:hypothetical protein